MSNEPRIDRRKCETASDGWRIPRVGTSSRKIYDLMRKGFGPRQIQVRLKMNYNTVGVLMWKIRNPQAANELTYRYTK